MGVVGCIGVWRSCDGYEMKWEYNGLLGVGWAGVCGKLRGEGGWGMIFQCDKDGKVGGSR